MDRREAGKFVRCGIPLATTQTVANQKKAAVEVRDSKRNAVLR